MTIASPSPAPAGARLTIDLDAVALNWRAMAERAGPAETAAAVKADAYGLGLGAVAPALWQAGCRTFFVALAAEGERLRALLPDAAIFVLNGFSAETLAACRRHRLAPVLGDPDEVEAFLALAGPEAPRPAIHVDTGMNRLGLTLEDAAALAGSADRMAALKPALVMSHFACADLPGHALTQRQIERFAAVRRLFPGLPGSLANSAGVMLGASAHHDLVRPGIALYGGETLPGAPAMRPVVTLEARVVQVRAVPSGEGVGYGAAATTERPSRIAILSLGYADGYPRRLGTGGGHAAFRGRRAPLIGRVSMDLMAVDVTDLGDAAPRRGDHMELIGPTIPLAEVARLAGTIDYEILTGLGARFERRHTG